MCSVFSTMYGPGRDESGFCFFPFVWAFPLRMSLNEGIPFPIAVGLCAAVFARAPPLSLRFKKIVTSFWIWFSCRFELSCSTLPEDIRLCIWARILVAARILFFSPVAACILFF